MSHLSAAELAPLAQQIRTHFLRQTFGGIWFWQFAVVRPHDQGQCVVDCQVVPNEADPNRAHLVLSLQHASGQGHAATLAIWEPQGLSIDAQGLRLTGAARLRFGGMEAWPEAQGGYRIRTPQGEGHFPGGEGRALWLQI